MTAKVLGAAFVALAAGTTLRTVFLQWRSEERLLGEMASALSHTVCQIRWKNQSLSAVFSSLAAKDAVGRYFEKVAEEMNRKIPLQEAWNNAFFDFPVAQEVLMQVQLDGDETHLLSSLERAAERLRSMQDERRKRRPEQRKLCTAAALCVTGTLILLLL